jgi:hypothetical protein
MSRAQIARGAVEAAMQVASRLGMGRVEPIVLHDSQHICLHLLPLAVVARVVRAGSVEDDRRFRRELSVTRHLLQRRAPIVGPVTDLPAGPHFDNGFGLTLWPFIDHVAADGGNREHVASAAAALARVHAALADFPEELPSFMNKIDKCRALLADRSALPALLAGDRCFLLMAYHRILASLDALPLKLVPLHGDALLGNVFITPEGALWNDFEDTCLGPREWDIGWLPDPGSKAFAPVDGDLLSLLSNLRSLCVSVWCWAKYETPDEREAAEYHLEYLKEQYT